MFSSRRRRDPLRWGRNVARTDLRTEQETQEAVRGAEKSSGEPELPNCPRINFPHPGCISRFCPFSSLCAAARVLSAGRAAISVPTGRAAPLHGVAPLSSLFPRRPSPRRRLHPPQSLVFFLPQAGRRPSCRLGIVSPPRRSRTRASPHHPGTPAASLSSSSPVESTPRKPPPVLRWKPAIGPPPRSDASVSSVGSSSSKQGWTQTRHLLLGKPCDHALAFLIEKRNINLEDYVHDYYSLQRFRAAYEGAVEPLTDMTQWPKVDLGFVLLPPLAKRSAGKPKKLRIKGCLDKGGSGKKSVNLGTQHRCKRCGELGHRQAGCPLHGTKQRKTKAKKNIDAVAPKGPSQPLVTTTSKKMTPMKKRKT